MRFLKSLWRRVEAELPAAVAPQPTILAPLPNGANPIHRFIDDMRLPREEHRRDLELRLGVRPDPIYRSDAVIFDAAIGIPGAMAPWIARSDAGMPPQFPITRFSALTWFQDDAHANLDRTARYLEAWFGPAEIGKQWNTLIATWRSGIAEVGLIAWPPAWQSGDLRNDAEDRQPRLRTACHVNVATGFCLSMSERERDWVAGFQPIAFDGSVGTARMARAGTSAPYDTALEYARAPETLAASWQGSLGLSFGDEALIIVSDQLFVVPRESIIELEVLRLTPAKGGGGSSLHARCRTQAKARDAQTLFLAQASDPDGMNGLGRQLAARLGCPVEIGPYFPDA
ncbi:MAG: hypothetical protein EOO23_03145 [Comamonadaceae bacterium]|nr:MAG: hypothetical protein EOO23_03145 [Comamonadaceae bacterium]